MKIVRLLLLLQREFFYDGIQDASASQTALIPIPAA